MCPVHDPRMANHGIVPHVAAGPAIDRRLSAISHGAAQVAALRFLGLQA